MCSKCSATLIWDFFLVCASYFIFLCRILHKPFVSPGRLNIPINKYAHSSRKKKMNKENPNLPLLPPPNNILGVDITGSLHKGTTLTPYLGGSLSWGMVPGKPRRMSRGFEWKKPRCVWDTPIFWTVVFDYGNASAAVGVTLFILNNANIVQRRMNRQFSEPRSIR